MTDQWPVKPTKQRKSVFRPTPRQRWLIIIVLIPLIWFLHTL
jgi:hypothetical protein